MPLRDHFRSCDPREPPWASFSCMWLTTIVGALNQSLPRDRYRAFIETHLALPARPGVVKGRPSFVRVADLQEPQGHVAIVDFVDPFWKPEAQHWRAFVNRCAHLVRRQVGLLVIDVVSDCSANLHDELIRTLGLDGPYVSPAETPLCAVTYEPIQHVDRDEVDVWFEPLTIGGILPAMAVALRGGPKVVLDLESTYRLACEYSGL